MAWHFSHHSTRSHKHKEASGWGQILLQFVVTHQHSCPRTLFVAGPITYDQHALVSSLCVTRALLSRSIFNLPIICIINEVIVPILALCSIFSLLFPSLLYATCLNVRALYDGANIFTNFKLLADISPPSLFIQHNTTAPQVFSNCNAHIAQIR